MNRSVDLLIVGLTAAARAAAIAAVQAGRRVLVVDPTTRRSRCRRFRRQLGGGIAGARRRVSVLTGVEVVCVDGVPRVEAVILRRLVTGRLLAVNAAALLVTTRVAVGVVAPTCCPCEKAAAAAANASAPE